MKLKNKFKIFTILGMFIPFIFVTSCSTASKKIGVWGNTQYVRSYELPDYEKDAQNVSLVSDVSQEAKSSTTYQIMNYSFADGNGDNIGDFIGLSQKLDYLKELGVDQLYLSPVSPASSYHGYDIIDYTDVAPELGSMEAFDNFLKKSHEMGFKVYIDMVFNHTSYEHPWFQEALNGNKKYMEYYNFKSLNIDAGDLGKNSYNFDKNFVNIKHKIKNLDQEYIAKFWSGMPDLNLDNPSVINELKNVQKFWTKKGVDGFRYDAFIEFFSSPGETQNNYNINKIFSELRKSSEEGESEAKRDPEFDSYMFGEWWGDPYSAMKYYKYDDKVILNSAYDGSNWKDEPLIYANYDKYRNIVDTYNKLSSKSRWMPFLDNHDDGRWLSKFRTYMRKSTGNAIVPGKPDDPLNSFEKNIMKLALFNMLGLPANPIIFQGDELGYHGNKNISDSKMREPMKWSNSKYSINFYEKRSGSDEIIVLGTSSDVENADSQIKNPDSIAYLVKQMNKIKKENEFVSSTDVNTFDNLNNYVDPTEDLDTVSGYARIDKATNKVILYLYNASGRVANINLKAKPNKVMLERNTSVSGSTVELKAQSYIVLGINI